MITATARGDTGLVPRRMADSQPGREGTVLTGARMPGILIGDEIRGRSAAWHVAGDQHEFCTVAGGRALTRFCLLVAATASCVYFGPCSFT